MRHRKLIFSGLATALAVLLVILIRPAHQWPNPPHLELVSVEHSGMFDQSGKEAWLVTFNIVNTNSQNQPDSYENSFFAKHERKIIEAKVRDHWSVVEGATLALGPGEATLSLYPNRHIETYVVVPPDADACRFWFNYAAFTEKKSFKSIVRTLVSQFPVSIRSRSPIWFRRWIGYPRHVPSEWKEIKLELPLHPPSASDHQPPPTQLLL